MKMLQNGRVKFQTQIKSQMFLLGYVSSPSRRLLQASHDPKSKKAYKNQNQIRGEMQENNTRESLQNAKIIVGITQSSLTGKQIPTLHAKCVTDSPNQSILVASRVAVMQL